MSNTLQNTNLYRWILGFTVAGMFAPPLIDGGGLKERVPSFAAVEDETDWTLAKSEEKYDETEWTLAKNDSKDTNEVETDWTLARNNSHDQEEADWTLA